MLDSIGRTVTSEAVLVVGAGPVGLLTAAELIRHGIAVRLVEREPSPHREARATVIHARTLELFEHVELSEPLLAEGQQLRFTTTYTKDMRQLKWFSFDAEDTRYPFLLSIQQYLTERILTEHLTRLGGKIERGVELSALAPSADEVAATLTGRDGSEEAAGFQYVVGCDGPHSAVRRALGLELEGGDYASTFVVAEVDAEWPFPADELVYFAGPTGILLCGPLPKRRTLFIADVPDDGDRPSPPTLAEVDALVRERATGGISARELHWASRFHLHHRCAPLLAKGRVFLAGDAAHICSLFGGQGMNMGFQDGVNLAWKLALVIAGEAPQTLLASYDAERRAVAEQELAFTDALYAGLFDRDHTLPHQVRRHYQAFLAGFDSVHERQRRAHVQLSLGYRGSPIVGESDSSAGQHQGVAGELRAHHDFGHGPRPGDRLPNPRLDDARGARAAPARLYDLLPPRGHALLLMTGVRKAGSEVASLEAIADSVSRRYGDLIQTRIVVGDPSGAPAAPFGIADPRAGVHHALGARDDCLYLVRPDLYVGFRCRPADEVPLLDHLENVLRARA